MASFKDWRELMCFRFFLLMGHLELTPVDDIVQIGMMCFRFSPDGTFRVDTSLDIPVDGIVQGLERIDVFPFFLLMGHLELKNSSGWHRSRIGEN
ncbi:hypothetical protein TNCV_3940181 [Trichonephila clavipes]|uniref:Uncharacterized protein n=1 Tax=Trichonephila clavipes TaxID=2585209 RepID=A0A8X6VVR3_TRICX|nr:hypothetical protein TNCV_3940181 [Trichonephila clavipes]